MSNELKLMEAKYSIICRNAAEAREKARKLTEQEQAMRRPLAQLRCKEFGEQHQIDLYLGAPLYMTAEARQHETNQGNTQIRFGEVVYLGNIFPDGTAQIQAEDPTDHTVGGMLNCGYPHELIIQMRKAYLEG